MAALLTLSLTLFAACGSANQKSGEAQSSAGQERTIKHALGETTLVGTPKRIVSTSVVLTGTLLALDAPVSASGGTKGGAIGADDKGFFLHWSKIADERKVKGLYQVELNLEAVAAEKPDLILMSSTGGDSTAEHYDQLKKIAPTVAINYNAETWEHVTDTVADVTGTKPKAEELKKSFAGEMATLKKSVQAPKEQVQAVVFAAPGSGVSFAKPGGPHDEIFKALGFDLAPAPTGDGSEGKGRADFVFTTPEQSVKALTAKNVLMVANNEADEAAFKKDPTYRNAPCHGPGGKTPPLGLASFKLDYYSATDMAKRLAAAYPKA